MAHQTVHRSWAYAFAMSLGSGLAKIAAGVAVLVSAVAFSAGLAAAEPGFSPIQSIPLPAGSQPTDLIQYGPTSCASTTDCTAVGGQFHGGPVADSESSGVWGVAAAIAVLAGATGSESRLSAVSCPSVGDCVAVGNYKVSRTSTQPLLVSEVSGTWGAATSPTLPVGANTGSSQLAALAGVWCASVGNCVVVGSFTGPGTSQFLMTAVERSGTWSAMAELRVGTDTGGTNLVSAMGLACTSTANCTAVASNGASYSWTKTNGSWGIPRLMSTNRHFFVYDVACPSPGMCIAVGGAVYSAEAITETSGKWGALHTLPPPSGSQATNVSSLYAIACQPTVCMAVGIAARLAAYGEYFPQYSVAATWSNGTWSPLALEQGVPAGSAASNSSFLEGVACPSPASCLAIGGGGVSPAPPSNGPPAYYPYSTVLTPG